MVKNFVVERWKGYQKKRLVEACRKISIAGLNLRALLAEHGEPLTLLVQGTVKDEPVGWTLRFQAGKMTVCGKLWPRGSREEHILELVEHSRGKWGALFYLICPKCQGHRRNLYSTGPDSKLYCRNCHDLTYVSVQFESKKTYRLRRWARGAMLAFGGFPVREFAEELGMERAFGLRPRRQNAP